MKKTNRLYSHKCVVTCLIDCMWATDSYTIVYVKVESCRKRRMWMRGYMYNYYTCSVVRVDAMLI